MGLEDAVLTTATAGGFARVEFTRNRRVMVSCGDGGTTLRLHECFRHASAEVVLAAALAVAAREPAERRTARAVVRAYLRATPPAPIAAAPPRRVPPADRPHLQRLRIEFDRVNAGHFGDGLPRVPLFLSGRMRRRNGHFCVFPMEIVLARRLCEQAVVGEAERTLRHEMIHLWQYTTGAPLGHGAAFRRWAERLEIHPRATRAVCWS